MPIDASSDGNPGLDPASTKVSPDDVDVPPASKVDDDLDDDLESAGTGAGTVDLDLGGIDKGAEADDGAADVDAGPKSGLDFDDLDDAGTGAKIDPSADLDDDPLGKDLGSALDDLDDDLGADAGDIGDIDDIGKADLDFDDPADTSVKGLAGVDPHDDDVDDDLDGGFEPKDDDLFDG